MKILGNVDVSRYAFKEPVMGGEYTGFKDNFTAAYNNSEALLKGNSKSSMIREFIDPLLEKMKEDGKWQNYEMSNYLTDQKYWADADGRSYTGDQLVAKRIYDYAQEHDTYKQYLKENGYDISTPDNLYQYFENQAAEQSAKRNEEYMQTAQKRTGFGALGDFTGTMASQMTDPLDAASLFIPVARGTKLMRQIGEAVAINVGIELFEYPSVREWHQRVTGEDYSPAEFAKNTGIIAVGTAGLVSAANLPMKSYLKAVSTKINRALTPQEEIEAIKAFQQAHAMKEGYEYRADPTFEKALDKSEADDILKKDSYISNDNSNSEHNSYVLSTLRNILNNDLRTLEKGPTAGIDTPSSITAIEKQFQNSETIAAKDILIDKGKYQFKSMPDEIPKGAIFDPELAGQVLVYEDRAGTKTIVDGHQRIKLAQEANANVEALVLREIDGFSQEMAKVSSMVRNFYEGSISKADLPKYKKYPDLVELIEQVNPGLKTAQGLVNLSPKAYMAMYHNIVGDDIGSLVGQFVQGEERQIAMMDILKKQEGITIAEAKTLIQDTLDRGVLDTYDMESIAKSFQALNYIPERKMLINQMIRDLQTENVKLKNTKLPKNSDQRVLNDARRTQNEKTIKLIRSYGNQEGEISDFITDGARAYKDAGGIGLEDFSRTATDNIRKGVDEGHFDRLSNSAELADRNLTAQIGKLATEVRESIPELSKYFDAAEAKGVADDIANVKSILDQEIKNNPELRNINIDFDADGNPIRLSQLLDDVAERDKHIEFIKRCQQ